MLVKTFTEARPCERIVRGEGIYLFSADGKKYVDFTSGITAHSILGYSNEVVIDAIKKQSELICHVDYKNFSDGVREELASVLLSRKSHALDAIYFVGSSGGEACEAAMKLSYAYHLARGDKNKYHFISRNQGYHGSTSDSQSLGDRPNLVLFEPFWPGHRHKISEHNYSRNSFKDETADQYCDRCAQELRDKIVDIGPDKVAGFVAETTLGGLVGDVVPHQSYWKKIRSVCNEFNVHLILDEVWCGTGTSGKIYSIDWDGITPDFIFLGKTLGAGYGAVSALVTRSDYVMAIKEKFQSIPHSITHQGHTLSCSAALAAQKIIHTDTILNNVIQRSNQIKHKINLRLKTSPFFKEIRGRGLRLSIEYSTPNNHWFGTTVAGILKDRSHILISGKWHRLSLSPALIITEEEVNYVVDNLCDVFLEVAENFSSYQSKFNYDGSFF